MAARLLSIVALSAGVLWSASACRSDRRDATTPGAGPAARADTGGAATAVAGDADAAAGEQPLTERECEALTEHVVQIGLRAHNEGEEPEHRPTTEQVARITTDLRAEFLPICLQLDRAAWQCAMAARDQGGLAACDPAP